LSEFVSLRVAFLLGEKNWRNWEVPEGQSWIPQFLSLKSINIKEYDFILTVRGARRLIQNIDVLVLGGWETPFYIYAMKLANKRNIRVIQFYESTRDSHRVNNRIVRNIRAKLISKSDIVITIGNASTRAVLDMGIKSKQILTLFNPVDVAWYHSYAAVNRNPVISGHHYLYAGQLIERKNIETIIRSFAAIKNNLDSLTIAGDGPQSEDLKNLTKLLGVVDSVVFKGHLSQEELARQYAESHTFILVSTNEVWGLVVNEALASGLHVVVSDKCGVADFVRDMEGVYICNTDKDSVQKAMQDSSRAWTGYVQAPEILRFTPEKFADQIISVISLL
jgi:glycosyltransferase involved in cell wall biosynthesis